MKKIEAIIRPERLQEVQDALDALGVSGLTVSDAKAGIDLAASTLEREEDQGFSYWSAGGRAPKVTAAPVAHLLPNYDENLIAHKDRHLVVSQGSGDGVTRIKAPFVHHLVIDGRLAGSWTRTVNRGVVAVECAMYVRPTADVARAIDAAASRLGQFLKLPATSSCLARRSSATAAAGRR